MRDSVTEFRRLQALLEITSTCWGSSKSIFEVDGGYGRDCQQAGSCGFVLTHSLSAQRKRLYMLIY